MTVWNLFAPKWLLVTSSLKLNRFRTLYILSLNFFLNTISLYLSVQVNLDLQYFPINLLLASGVDGASPIMLKSFLLIALDPLFIIFNNLLNNSTISLLWTFLKLYRSLKLIQIQIFSQFF